MRHLVRNIAGPHLRPLKLGESHDIGQFFRRLLPSSSRQSVLLLSVALVHGLAAMLFWIHNLNSSLICPDSRSPLTPSSSKPSSEVIFPFTPSPKHPEILQLFFQFNLEGLQTPSLLLQCAAETRWRSPVVPRRSPGVRGARSSDAQSPGRNAI